MNQLRNSIVKFWQSPTRWVMVITFVGMAFGLIFHVLIPRRLGEGATADALITALKVVLLVDTIFREGAKFSLVPLFINEEKSKKGVAYQHFTNGILNLSLGVGAMIALSIAIFAPWIAHGLLSSSSAETRTEMTTLLRYCAPLLIFGCGSTILGAYLNSQRRFKTVALRNALPPGIATIAFLLLWSTEQLSYWVALAYAAGFVAYFGWLCIGMYQTGHRYQLKWVSFETLRSLKNAISLPTLGFAIRQMSARLLVEIYLVEKIGEGAITRYNSAFRIYSAIQTLIGISIATTGLPDMATHDVEDNRNKLKRTLYRNIIAALCIAIPVSLLLLLSHAKITSMLFFYGQSNLNDASSQQIAQLLFWLSTGMTFACLIPVLNAGLYAQKAYSLVFRNMLTMAVINFVLAFGFVNVWQLVGIPIAVAVTAVLAVANLTYLLRKTGISLFTRN